MNIKTENQLVEELGKGLTSQFNTDTFIREFSAGYGIADLAFARNFFTNKNKVDRQPINNYYALKGILSLPNSIPFTKNDFINVTGISNSMCTKVFQILIEKDYIQRKGGNKFIKTLDLYSPIKKLVAIEVKLKDWKQGILQARRYKSFTDECYLAILADYERNIDYDLLNQFGIGLILFNQNDGKILIKKQPGRIKLLTIYNTLLDTFAKEEFLYRTNINTSLKSLSM